MQIRVRVPGQLRQLVGGAGTVLVDLAGDGKTTVGAVLDALAGEHPALEWRIRDEQGTTRVHVNLFVGADNIRDLDGLSTPIGPRDELSVVPAVSGGCVSPRRLRP